MFRGNLILGYGSLILIWFKEIMKKLKVLSLFDGISGAAQALKELGVECDYYASEVDKWAIEISRKNHPDIVQLGDVKMSKVIILPFFL